MNIVCSELSNRRRDGRTDAASINIEFDDVTVTTLDWSLGVFLVEGYDGRLHSGDQVAVGIGFEVDGHHFHHVTPIEVVRVEPYSNQPAANFIGLDNETMSTLEGLLTGRLRRQIMRQKVG